MNMKSSSNQRLNASYEKLETWMPGELGVDSAAASLDVHKEQVLAIFRKELDSGSGEKKRRSALHPNGTTDNFSAWQSGDFDARPAPKSNSSWIFAEFDEKFENTAQAGRFENLDFVERDRNGQSDAENQSSMILERARLQAEEIILAAQAEADNVLSQAQDEIDEQKKEGYLLGQNEAQREFQEALKATQVMVEDVRAWHANLTSQGEQILVEMLKDISQKLFGDGAELDTNALQVNLNRIMESAQGLGNLNIFLNPKDARNLDPSWSEYQALITGNQVKIIPSGKITRGGCIVKGNMGTIDASVETQLGAILSTFDEKLEVTE